MIDKLLHFLLFVRIVKTKIDEGGTMNDKMLHFLILLVVTFGIALISPITAFVVGLIIAVCKELYDKHVKKTYIDIYDLLADYGGIFTALILAQIVVESFK